MKKPQAPPSLIDIAEKNLARVAALHRRIFADTFNARLGTPFAKAFFRSFLRQEKGIALCLVAQDGEILGYAAGAPHAATARPDRALMLHGALGVLRHPALLWSAEVRRRIGGKVRAFAKRGNSQQAIENVEDTPGAPADDARVLAENALAEIEANLVMYLTIIGVAPEARGQNAGTVLLHAFEKRAATLGMQALQLSVLRQNAAARALYEKCDWNPVAGGDAEAMIYSKMLGRTAERDEN